MATVITVPLVMSDAALKICTEFKIDLTELCRESVKKEIEARAETSETVLSVNPTIRNEKLRNQVLQMQEQIARLVETEGKADWMKFL